jgi:flagellar hook-associated protein 1 FlgK
LAVAALRNAPVLEGASLAEVYAAQVGELGLEASSAYRAAEYQEMVVQEVEDQLSSVSGVSVDEEMIRLMEYQWAYEAAARLIQSSREMIQAVLDLVR